MTTHTTHQTVRDRNSTSKSLKLSFSYRIDDGRGFKESGCNARGMMGPLTVWAYASGIVCAGLFVTAIASLPLLDNPAWGWLPVLTFVLGGGLLIFVYIAFMRKSQCALLIAGGAVYEIAAELYIQKFNGAGLEQARL